MKGLLIKDLKLLMGQKQFFVMVCGLGFLFTFANGDPTFAIPYVAIMLCMFAVSTISYDEYDNGGAFLFSLPITRKLYVAEKYIYGFCLGLVSIVVTSVFAVIVMMVRNNWIGSGEFLTLIVVSMLLVAVALGSMIPVQLKFGAEKSRMALIGVSMAIALIVYFSYKILYGMGVDVEQALEAAFSGMTLVMLIVILSVVGIAMLLISYIISVKVMEKKEY